ncbi:hypothetical protein ACA910_021811 [Epithemia clementina (nom. ined.)]
MSFCGAHSPSLGLSGSFGSMNRLTNSEKKLRTSREATKSSNHSETTALLSSRSSGAVDLDQHTSNNTLNWTLLTTIVVVTIGSSLQFGYATGVMNNSKDFIMGDFHDRGKEYSLLQWGTTVSCFGVGGLVGAVLGPKVLGQYCGRRATLLINNIFLVISSLFITIAPVWWFQAVGRIFVGIVAGTATAVVPTYFSEISPVEIRGAVGTVHQLGITIGILLSQALSTPSLHLLGSKESWPWLFVVPVLCGALEVLVLPCCPESPSYLYQTQGEDAARAALIRLQSKEVVDEYVQYIKEEAESSSSNSKRDDADTKKEDKNMTLRELVLDKTLRKQLIVGVTVQLMMQFSGIDALLYYSTTVFQQAAVSDPELATTCLGIINVLVTIVAVKYMDSAGRKTLLTWSWIGMCISFVLLTASFVLRDYNVPHMDQLSVMATVGVIIFFAFGPGCIAWFIIAEIFPLPARDSAMALGIFVNWLANWLVAFCFPILLAKTQPYTFLVFVGTTAFFLYFTVNFVPETKGKTVSELAASFDELPLCTC